MAASYFYDLALSASVASAFSSPAAHAIHTLCMDQDGPALSSVADLAMRQPLAHVNISFRKAFLRPINLLMIPISYTVSTTLYGNYLCVLSPLSSALALVLSAETDVSLVRVHWAPSHPVSHRSCSDFLGGCCTERSQKTINFSLKPSLPGKCNLSASLSLCHT